MNCTFGANLKKVRQEKGMSIYTLSAMVGCNPSNISKWENSKRYPQVIWIYRLADALKVNPERLVSVE